MEEKKMLVGGIFDFKKCSNMIQSDSDEFSNFTNNVANGCKNNLFFTKF